MKFQTALIEGTLIKRYKRFLADVKLNNGSIITAHTANTGSMMGLIDPGNKVYLSFHDDPKRKLKYSLEIIQVKKTLVGINTGLPNKLVKEAIENGTIKELQGYAHIQPEVKYGTNSRIDLLLTDKKNKKCYVEVKQVTLVQNKICSFPDSISTRGQKHLVELQNMVREGHRAVMIYVIQRADADRFTPADAIDPEYGKLLRQAVKNKVEAYCYQAKVSAKSISIHQQLPVILKEAPC